MLNRFKGMRVVGPLMFACAATVGFLLSYLANPSGSHAAVGRSFTVREETRMFQHKDRPALMILDSELARRSDGSWAHFYSAMYPDGSRKKVLENVDLRSLTTMQSEPVTESVMTLHIPLAEAPAFISAGFHACDGSETSSGLRHSSILGYDVIRVVITDELGTEVRWVAPALDCYALQTAFTAVDGKSTSTSATEIQEGEPEASLFQVPTGYTERAPAEIQTLYAQRLPGGVFLPNDMLGIVEGRYQRGQKRGR